MNATRWDRIPDSTKLGHIAAGASDRSGSRLPAGRHTVPALILCVMCGTASAAAQDSPQADLSGLSMEELATMKVDSVYGASKFLQAADDAATSITVVTGEEIEKYGYRTLADVLRTVRGFYVINDRNYSYVGVRGLSLPGDYNARILFLLDGHRINDNIFDGAYVGTGFPVDVALIKRIEIILGPNSSVYGTGAFVALINVITSRGRDLNGAELATDAASWNSYQGRMTYGSRLDNGLEALVSGSLLNSQGQRQLFYPEFNSPATNNGIAQDANGAQTYSVFADIILRDFNIHLLQSSVTKHIPTASFGTVFNDSRTQTTDARRYIDIQYHHVFGSWETLGRASYDWYDYHGIYVYDYPGKGVPPFTENYDAANGDWLDFQGDASRVFKRHKVTLGTEVRQDIGQQQVNYDIQPYQPYFDDHRSARVWALYGQDQVLHSQEPERRGGASQRLEPPVRKCAQSTNRAAPWHRPQHRCQGELRAGIPRPQRLRIVLCGQQQQHRRPVLEAGENPQLGSGGRASIREDLPRDRDGFCESDRRFDRPGPRSDHRPPGLHEPGSGADEGGRARAGCQMAGWHGRRDVVFAPGFQERGDRRRPDQLPRSAGQGEPQRASGAAEAICQRRQPVRG